MTAILDSDGFLIWTESECPSVLRSWVGLFVLFVWGFMVAESLVHLCSLFRFNGFYGFGSRLFLQLWNFSKNPRMGLFLSHRVGGDRNLVELLRRVGIA